MNATAAREVLAALGIAARPARPAPALPNYAGIRQYRKARQTGLYIGVYNGEEAGLDTDDGENPWSTICEPHGFIVSHQTLALALSSAAYPMEWCETCMGCDGYGPTA